MASPAYVTLALVPGIGRARLDLLLGRFGSAEDVLQASQAELDAVPSISKPAACAIRAATIESGQSVIDQATQAGGRVLEWTITDTFSSGDRVAAQWRFTCHWDGADHAFDGSSLATVRDGKIARLREYATIAPLYEWQGR